MAESRTPKHDFAPSWLKLPSQENKFSKSASSEQYTSSLNDTKVLSPRSNGKDNDTRRPFRSRRDSGGYRSTNDRYDTLYRQHSFDNYQDNGRYGSKLRHHSVDDYYAFNYNNYSSYNGYSDSQYGSHDLSARQPKYHHPNSRYEKLMDVYPAPYYDMYPYDFYAGEPYYSYPSRVGGKPSRNSYADTRAPRDKHKQKTHSPTPPPEPDFNDEFPSLNGQMGDTTHTKLNNGATVWDKPPKKNVDVNENASTDYSKDSPNKVSSSFKVLIPNKNILPKKGSLRINTTLTNQDPGLINRIIPKENGVSSPTPPMEILNPRLHTPARIKGDKSEFLRTLRSTCNGSDTSKSSQSPDREIITEPLVNGVESLSVDSPADEKLLSSSVEAEQRLLREMGWSEADDGEEYVITEAEMKEFQHLSQQVKQHPTNGLVRALPKTWSPGHMTNTTANHTPASDLNDDQSSSSDSDDSC